MSRQELTEITSKSDRDLLIIALTKIDHLEAQFITFTKENKEELKGQRKDIDKLSASKYKITGAVLAIGLISTVANIAILFTKLLQ